MAGEGIEDSEDYLGKDVHVVQVELMDGSETVVEGVDDVGLDAGRGAATLVNKVQVVGKAAVQDGGRVQKLGKVGQQVDGDKLVLGELDLADGGEQEREEDEEGVVGVGGLVGVGGGCGERGSEEHVVDGTGVGGEVELEVLEEERQVVAQADGDFVRGQASAYEALMNKNERCQI